MGNARERTSAPPAEAVESGTRVKALGLVAYLGRDRAFAEVLRKHCRPLGIVVRAPESREQARRLAASRRLRIFVIDLDTPDLIPPELRLDRLRPAGSGGSGRIVMSRVKNEVNVVGFSPHEHDGVCQRISKTFRDEGERRVALEELLLGVSPAIREVRAQIRDAAPFRDVNVLVLGETGTGKELVAQAIHRTGPAPDEAFIAINCAAIPETLFESELFGHQPGTFTGAAGSRVGLLEEAGRGTLFLDEVGEMPRGLQPKLLRALETRSFRRIGSNREQPFGARLVSATNRDVSNLAGLRDDVFFRLAGFTVQLPPLRDRLEDVPVLARAFLRRFAENHLMPTPELRDDALEVLQSHLWPGNVRELKVVVERAAIVAREGMVTAHEVRDGLIAPRPRTPRPPVRSSRPPPPPSAARTPRPTPSMGIGVGGRGLKEIEREIILRVLEKNDGNVARTARQLKIPRSTLRARLRNYGL